MTAPRSVDYMVVGGGFYGCCLALFLRSVTRDVMLVEAGDALMTRASRINQARLHAGFHYPRSMLTALKSRQLCQRFAADFPDAIVSDFRMLYAIARQRSKVSANRFHKMFRTMHAPITPATPSERALFDDSRIDAVFRVEEYAFDYAILARQLSKRLEAHHVDLRLNTEIIRIDDDPVASHATVHLADGSKVRARHVFNVTYAQINHLLRQSHLPLARLKHEVSEIVLVDPPEEMHGYGVTVMDGPFFSLMPYPPEGKYSLTHVRYTPHRSWTDQAQPASAYQVFSSFPKHSRARHMILDAARYMPCMNSLSPARSLFDIKTVLVKNEIDDGRPILVHQDPPGGRVTSVLGGKIDNIYDLFAHLHAAHPALAAANTGLLISSGDNHDANPR